MRLQYFGMVLCTMAHLSVHSQTSLKISKYIHLPKDSVESHTLISNLNQFLKLCQGDNANNTFVYPPERVETFMLVDEFKEIEKSKGFGDDAFYKPYVTNVVALDSTGYQIQIAHMGTHEGIPYLRTSYNLVAHRSGESFLFSSPLKMNTVNWKHKNFHDIHFYFQDTANVKHMEQYARLVREFDKKLGRQNQLIHIYLAKDATELLRLFGVDYRMDYNGRNQLVFKAVNENESLIIYGNGHQGRSFFDSHDLWHERLGMVVSRSKVNKPVDEGCAYLYGGSWGLTWEEIFRAFDEQIIPQNPDWTAVKEKRMDFGTKGYKNSADNIINALLVKKIETEKGFDAVWELLNIGPFEPGNATYYKVLEKLTSITKEKYNAEIWKLIQAEKQAIQSSGH
ncbi:MAG: hypothetical protein AB3N16_02445 [Flavobacteriaceae bacterium]